MGDGSCRGVRQWPFGSLDLLDSLVARRSACQPSRYTLFQKSYRLCLDAWEPGSSSKQLLLRQHALVLSLLPRRRLRALLPASSPASCMFRSSINPCPRNAPPLHILLEEAREPERRNHATQASRGCAYVSRRQGQTIPGLGEVPCNGPRSTSSSAEGVNSLGRMYSICATDSFLPSQPPNHELASAADVF